MASTQVQITGGAFQDAAGNTLANGYLLLSLNQDAQVSSQEVGSGVSVNVPLDSSGNVTAVNLWPNDVLSPSNTFYNASAYSENGQLVWGPSAQQIFSSPSPYDIGAWVPSSVALVSQQAGITGLLEAGDNVTLSGSGTSSSPYVISSEGGSDGITQLTGDVTAGPGSGSVAATVTGVNGAALPASSAYVGTNSSEQIVTATTPLLPSNNLSDVANAATSRTNLGLGTIATQNASSVNITGGSITGTSIGAGATSTAAFTTLTVSSGGSSSVIGNSTELAGLNSSGVTQWSLTNATGAAAFKQLAIDGSQTITGVQGSTGTNLTAATGTFTSGNLVATDADGNVVDSGVAKPLSAFGTMATQNASAVTVTGGAVDGTTIGATTASTGSFSGGSSSPSLTITNTFPYDTGDHQGFVIKNSSTTSLMMTGVGSNVSGTSGPKIEFIDTTHPRFLDFGNYMSMGCPDTTNFVWTTDNNGSSGFVERMRITAAGTIGMGTASPSSCAGLQVASTTKGFLPPVMTTAQKTAISSPVAGLCVYDSTLGSLCFYNGSAWKTVTAS